MQQSDGGGTNHVLRIVVENMLYPITVDILHTIFSKFGFVLKIITFTKNSKASFFPLLLYVSGLLPRSFDEMTAERDKYCFLNTLYWLAAAMVKVTTGSGDCKRW